MSREPGESLAAAPPHTPSSDAIICYSISIATLPPSPSLSFFWFCFEIYSGEEGEEEDNTSNRWGYGKVMQLDKLMTRNLL